MSLRCNARALAGALAVAVGVLATGMAHDAACQSRPAGKRGWSWRTASVDTRADHLHVLFGPDADPGGWVLVARVGRSQGRVFSVQWLVDTEATQNRDLVEAVRHDLDFYLKVVAGPDPWPYARHHCDTTSNLYGEVHWSSSRHARH